MIKTYLNKQISRRIELGHPWIFDNEINEIEGEVAGGSITRVYGFNKKYIGTGFINPKSKISIRLLTRDPGITIDGRFFADRIREAWSYRKKIGYTENCRLVFGEADGLPALIIDKFNAYFVLQTLALGMDLWKPAIAEALQEIFSPKGIYERNDAPVRALEGLPLQKGFLSASFDPCIEINENGMKMLVDLEQGQKTGYFLDQQDNRRAIRHIVHDADVLGAFCYTGSFELHAAYYGARSVLGIDISEQAIAMARQNASLNNLNQVVRFDAINAFDALKQWSREGRQFDVVMLDPPAFTKSRETIQKAIAGYKEINLRAMKLVKKGGFLVTSSCTNLVEPSVFLQTIWSAAADAKRKLRQVTFQSQSSDHPIILHLENTNYLKFLIVQVQ